MLEKRISKTVYANKANSGYNMNFPAYAVKKFGQNYILDIYSDKIVMIPITKI